MVIEVFVGDLSDPEFDYEKGDWNGNCPKRISDVFPDSYPLFLEMAEKIKSGELDGKQTDWGSWTIPLYPEQIIDVMKNFYDHQKFSSDQRIKELVIYLKGLQQDEKYGLVACEMP